MQLRSPKFDWPLLIVVRERRRDAARTALQQAQQLASDGEAQVRRAEADWQAQLAARDQHAQSLRQQFTTGSASVAEMRHGGAWDGALAQRIDERARALTEARSKLAQLQEGVAQKRRALLKADAELDQARQMQAKSRRELRRVAELRLEDTLDEAGVHAWQRRANGGLA